MKIKREIKIGIAFVVAILLFIWGINYLKGSDILKDQRYVYGVYNRVDGLIPANPVNVKGVKIGQVDEVRFMQNAQTQVLVKMIITSDIKIPGNSLARIYSSDLMGSKAVEIKLGNSGKLLQSGDTLKTDIEESLKEEVNRQVLPLKRKAENLILSIDSVVTVVRYILDEDTRENLSQSFVSIRKTISNLERSSSNIDTLLAAEKSRLSGIISNVDAIAYNLRQSNSEVTNILSNLSAVSDTLAQANLSKTLGKTNQTLDQINRITTKIDEGEGSLGLLVNNDTLYHKLESSAAELDMLLRDIKLNPNRYVTFSIFGRNPDKNQYEPPKSEEEKGN
ncbi:MAG: MlaD family protein [Bacteroidales bacterium]|nr:MlaD family protein [Bacteroidales bacterium]